jgi:hypothetical protein
MTSYRLDGIMLIIGTLRIFLESHRGLLRFFLPRNANPVHIAGLGT